MWVPVPWVKVAPGRYVRGEAHDPAPDRPTEPPEVGVTEPATPEVGLLPEAVPEEASRVPEAGDSPDDPGDSAGVEDGEATATDHGLDRS